MYTFIEKHWRDHYQRIVKRTSFGAGSVEAAEDIVQTAYERALRYHASCDIKRFNEWFSMLLKNALIDYKNNERGYSTVEVDNEEVDGEYDSLFSDQVIREIFNRIELKPDDQAEILRLHFKYDYRPIDISHMTVHTYSKCHHIIERFRDEMKRIYK